MKTTFPPLTRIPLSALLAVLAWPGQASATGEDNFNDNNKDTTKWGTDVTNGNGVLTEAGQSLRYTCAAGTVDDSAARPWNATRFPYDADWEMQVDCFNNSSPMAPLQVNSMGIVLESPISSDTDLFLELYNSALGVGATERTGFFTEMTANGVGAGTEDSGELPITGGAIHLGWNSVTMVLTCSYDADLSDGYQWTPLATFGLSGAGGTHNADWGMAPTDQFFISLFGYSNAMSVPAGQMALDNFSETGGVATSGGTRPDPTGSFEFPFPISNDLLTRIASLTGNYQGVSPVSPNRGYSLDVAQDESGKVMGMGTVSGVADKSGNSDLDLSLGKVKTSNGEPVAELKSSFKGTADGMDASFKSKASFPLDLVEVGSVPVVAGGGVALPLGVAGTATYNGKVAGVPFSGKNEPLEFEAPPGAEDNLKQDWTLQLEIARKEIKGKERTVAAATLTLPTGDVIEFPEKRVKYSEKKGYKIAFKKGTNTTAVPNAVDKKASVVLKGLNFERQGDEWIPNAGTITYRFLGQNGVAELADFLTP